MKFRAQLGLQSLIQSGFISDRKTSVRPLCVKMALICKNWVKVRVRVRVRVRDRIRVRVRIGVSVSSLYRQGPHFYR